MNSTDLIIFNSSYDLANNIRYSFGEKLISYILTPMNTIFTLFVVGY